MPTLEFPDSASLDETIAKRLLGKNYNIPIYNENDSGAVVIGVIEYVFEWVPNSRLALSQRSRTTSAAFRLVPYFTPPFDFEYAWSTTDRWTRVWNQEEEGVTARYNRGILWASSFVDEYAYTWSNYRDSTDELRMDGMIEVMKGQLNFSNLIDGIRRLLRNGQNGITFDYAYMHASDQTLVARQIAEDLLELFVFCALCGTVTCTVPNEEENHNLCMQNTSPHVNNRAHSGHTSTDDVTFLPFDRNSMWWEWSSLIDLENKDTWGDTMCSSCVTNHTRTVVNSTRGNGRYMVACRICSEVLVIEGEYFQHLDYNFANYVDIPYINICSHCIFQAGYDFCDGCNMQSQQRTNEECNYCARRHSNDDIGVIKNYSYRPAYVFHPDPHTNLNKPLYIGMEIEIEFEKDVDKAVKEWLPKLEPKGLFYAKEDGSIHYGFELVTHPFDPKWGMDNFPFDSFQELIDDYTAKPVSSTCGTHLHMAKEAFSMAHLWKFLQLHEKMADFLGVLGGRGTGANYGNFNLSVAAEKTNRLTFVKNKDRGAAFSIDRSRAVNLLPTDTIELRYPRGGCAPNEVAKNIQLAQCLYDYSDFVQVGDVKDGAFDDSGFLLDWIQEGNYEYLLKWIESTMPKSKKLRERTAI